MKMQTFTIDSMFAHLSPRRRINLLRGRRCALTRHRLLTGDVLSLISMAHKRRPQIALARSVNGHVSIEPTNELVESVLKGGNIRMKKGLPPIKR